MSAFETAENGTVSRIEPPALKKTVSTNPVGVINPVSPQEHRHPPRTLTSPVRTQEYRQPLRTLLASTSSLNAGLNLNTVSLLNTVNLNTVSLNTGSLNTVSPNTVSPNTVSPNTVSPNTVSSNIVNLNTVSLNIVTLKTITDPHRSDKAQTLNITPSNLILTTFQPRSRLLSNINSLNIGLSQNKVYEPEVKCVCVNAVRLSSPTSSRQSHVEKQEDGNKLRPGCLMGIYGSI